MFAFDNSYARLPPRFFANVAPTRVSAPRILKVNRALSELLGLDPDRLDAAILSGNVVPSGAEPIAAAYAGHQFGAFVHQLGDGRAILLGEIVAKDGRRRDIQLKGAGPTPFSRGGDGRAALGPVIREYVVSEAMAALGVPTTRALAAVITGDLVLREQALPGAILTRVASSHIRVGTFEFFHARSDHAALARLTTYALNRHYPDARGDEKNEALTLLECVIDAQARLVAQWLGIGFIHGVMNTDNTSIAGETIDYGPCAFLDEFDPAKVFSSIDRGGRYAFGNQPRIALFNLACLAETLLPLIAGEGGNIDDAVRGAGERLDRFRATFEDAYARTLRQKLGLARDEEGDAALSNDLLERLAASEVDYTRFFRGLSSAAGDASGDATLASLFREPGAFHEWVLRWRARLDHETDDAIAIGERMHRANPAFIPRNHRIEEAIEAAVSGELAPFERLVSVLARPYDDQPEHADLAIPPRPEQRVRATFCGT